MLSYKWSYPKFKYESKLDSISEENEDISADFSSSSDDEDIGLNDEENYVDMDDVDTTTDSDISFDEQIMNVEDEDVLEVVEQYIADNIDLSIRSQYGNTAFHAKGQMKVKTPKPENGTDTSFKRHKFQWGKGKFAKIFGDQTSSLHSP